MKRVLKIGFYIVLLMSPLIAMWASNIKPVVLWTDALIYVLLITIVIFFSYVRSKEHLVAPWRHVVRRPLAVVSLVVLFSYVLVGLLDSVHFRMLLPVQISAQTETVQTDVKPAGKSEEYYSVEVLSLLDVIANPVRNRIEKSYSAPMATHLYTIETVEQADGSTLRTYPRLKYGGAHLNDPETEYRADVFSRVARAFVEGLIVWAVMVILWVAYLARKEHIKLLELLQQIFAGKTVLPWRVIFLTMGILLFLGAIIIELGVAYHLLGTDKVGNDVLYLSFKSIRTGLVIGTLTTLIMLPFAIMLGIMAGHFRGWVDDVIQYIYTTLSSIPGVLLIAAAILSVDLYINNNPDLFETVVERADLRLLFLCMILGITSWTGLCRLLRGETLKLREMDYIQAANAFGVSHMKIISRHILPNVMHIVLIAIVLDFSGLVLAEAVLSYVGVGVDPSMVSWGNMINGARLEMAREPVVWWSLVAAFWFMFLLVLAANLFSDAVRDAFDPRVSQGRS